MDHKKPKFVPRRPPGSSRLAPYEAELIRMASGQDRTYTEPEILAHLDSAYGVKVARSTLSSFINKRLRKRQRLAEKFAVVLTPPIFTSSQLAATTPATPITKPAAEVIPNPNASTNSNVSTPPKTITPPVQENVPAENRGRGIINRTPTQKEIDIQKIIDGIGMPTKSLLNSTFKNQPK
jgi:hypothetical protein